MGMTNKEEALDWLYRLRSEIYVYMPKEWLIPMNNALDMAIKALEQEPTTKNDSSELDKNSKKLEKDFGESDFISRDSAIKALDYDIKCFKFKFGVHKYMDDIAKLLNTIYETQVNNIKALPPVTPQEPKEITLEDVKGYCKTRLLTIITNELYHELIHYKIKPIELDKIRAEIEAKYGQCSICEYDSDYDGKWYQVGDIADILQIIDKYNADKEQNE